MDDDADCVAHDWALNELALEQGRFARSSVCTRCGAVRYEPAPDSSTRPPL